MILAKVILYALCVCVRVRARLSVCVWVGVYKREENVDVSDKGRVREVIGRERK